MSLTTRYAMALAVLVVGTILLAACTDSGEKEPVTTTPSGQAPTQAPKAERSTPAPEGRTPVASPATTEIDASALVTYEEADEALGEFDIGGLCGTIYCRHNTDSGKYLQVERGSPQDFEAGAELQGVHSEAGEELQLQGVKGEPVPGVGDEAAWFDGGVAVLSVRQGDAYFRIILNLPEVDSSTKLEIAKGLAAKAVERIP